MNKKKTILLVCLSALAGFGFSLALYLKGKPAPLRDLDLTQSSTLTVGAAKETTYFFSYSFATTNGEPVSGYQVFHMPQPIRSRQAMQPLIQEMERVFTNRSTAIVITSLNALP